MISNWCKYRARRHEGGKWIGHARRHEGEKWIGHARRHEGEKWIGHARLLAEVPSTSIEYCEV